MEEFNFKPKQEQGPSEHEKNIREVFRLSPELAAIGTEEQYQKFLEGIFPESTVRDIVWHATDAKINTYTKEKEGANVGEGNKNKGIYFTDNKSATMLKSLLGAKVILPTVVDIRNPQTVKDLRVEVDPKDHDGILSEEVIEDALGDMRIPIVVAFEPEQAHILGSESDLERFKEFVASQSA